MENPLVTCPACGRCRQTSQHIAQCSGTFSPSSAWTSDQAMAICIALAAMQSSAASRHERFGSADLTL